MKKKITIFLIISIIILSAVGFWYLQRNIYGKEKLKPEILGPREVELAEEIEYIVRYKNNSNILLEEPRVMFEYPENSIVVVETGESDFYRQEKQVEDIYPGEEKTIKFKGRLFGKEGEVKTAKLTISYRPKNLAARFESETIFTTVIKSIPITFEYDIPSKIDSGKENSFKLNYFSNLDYPLSNLVVRTQYPAGFEFRESQPNSLLGNTEWEIPLLNKAEGRRIVISGVLNGEVGEVKIFKATLGVLLGEKFVVLKEISRGTEINKPLIFISQRINDSPQYIASPGDFLHYEIFFKNTGEQVFENLFMIVQLEKNFFDFETLQLNSGQLQTDASSIIWDHNNVSQLKFLPSMEEGKVDFWIKLKKDLPRNPSIRTKVSVGLAKEEFVNRINTNFSLAQKSYYYQPPFQNSGPLPPLVGAPTTYTISWQVKNSYNDVKNLKVKAVLPRYARLTGEISPKDARIVFDEFSREIVWEVGDLSADVLSSEIFFQVIFTPEYEQKGQSPELVSQVRVTGEDDWTGQIIQTGFLGVDISLINDPSVIENQRVVQ